MLIQYKDQVEPINWVSHNGGGAWGVPPTASYDFFDPQLPPIITDALSMGCAPTEKWTPPPSPNWKTTLHWKANSPSRKQFLEKNPQKLEACISPHKTTLEKDDRNSTKMWFSHLEHSKFCKKNGSLLENITLLN